MIKNKKVLSILSRIKCKRLIESINEFAEDEREGRSDFEILSEEINYFRSLYEEEGHPFQRSLVNARRLVRKTRNGKDIPVDIVSFKPKKGYEPTDIEEAKEIIAEYRQLVYYSDRMGG